MKTILIDSIHGKFEVLIDDDELERVSQYTWSVSKSTGSYFRVETRIKNKLVRLHRFLLNITDKKIEVDHIDRNPMNNQKNNLRLATRDQNMRNVTAKPNKTGYRGVYQNHGNGKYRACISIKNKTYHIPGNFETAEEASKVRDAWALKVSGEFAILNHKKGGSPRV